MPQRSDNLEWPNDQVLHLVNEYKKRPLLWDPTHELYRMQTDKYKAWMEIAAIFDTDITVLRKKFNSIFASHRREKAKVRFGTRSYWFLYDHLDFLPNHIANADAERKDAANSDNDDQLDLGQEDNNSFTSDNDQEVIQEEIIIKHERETPSPPPPPPKKVRVPVKPVVPRVVEHMVKQKPNRRQPPVKTVTTSPSPVVHDSKGNDECDTFGQYIAVSLRKHDERTRSMIKQAINNILFEQEMKKYCTSNYSVDVEENPLTIGDDDG